MMVGQACPRSPLTPTLHSPQLSPTLPLTMVVGESLEGKKVSCVASSLVVLVCGFPFLEYRFVMFCNATQIGVSRGVFEGRQTKSSVCLDRMKNVLSTFEQIRQIFAFVLLRTDSGQTNCTFSTAMSTTTTTTTGWTCCVCSHACTTRCSCGLGIHAACAPVSFMVPEGPIVLCAGCADVARAHSSGVGGGNTHAVTSQSEDTSRPQSPQAPHSPMSQPQENLSSPPPPQPAQPATSHVAVASPSPTPSPAPTPTPTTRSGTPLQGSSARPSSVRKNVSWRGKEATLVGVVFELLQRGDIPTNMHKQPDSPAWEIVGEALKGPLGQPMISGTELGKKAARQMKGVHLVCVCDGCLTRLHSQ